MKNTIYIISFFAYSGYYMGLSIILSLNLGSLSRYYSVPLRVFMAMLMLVVIHRYRYSLFIKSKNTIYLVLFMLFWSFYLFKTLTTEATTTPNVLWRNWYEYPFYSIIYVVIPFCMFYCINFQKYRDTILNAFISSGFLFGIVSLILYGKYLAMGIGRLSLAKYTTGEEVVNPLVLSYSGTLTIMFCLYKLLIQKEKTILKRTYLLVTIILAFIMFLLGSSRGSVVALFVALPILIYYSPNKIKLKFVALIILLAPIIIWAIDKSGSNIFSRIENTSEDSGGGRGTLWQKALNHFYENPIIGGKIEIGGVYPHNFILEILMSTGIIGLLLIGPVLIRGFILGKTFSRKSNSFLFVFIMFLMAIVQYSFSGGVYTATILFLPLGIILGMNKNLNS
jgi:O-antigen ligase